MTADLRALLPELLVCGTAVLALLADVVGRREGRAAPTGVVTTIGFLGLGAALWVSGGDYLAWRAAVQDSGTASKVLYGRMLAVDALAHFFRCLVLVAGGLVLGMTLGLPGLTERRRGAYIALLLLACLAMMFMALSNDLLMLFLSMEFLGIASYVLVGYEKDRLASSEGAVKYFLVGAFSSAIMLYGMTLVYGLARTTTLPGIAQWYAGMGGGEMHPLLMAGIFFILVGLGFKIAMVPFHMWVPDVYQGAPTPVTAFLAVASKAVGLAVVLRTFLVGLPSPVGLLAILTGVTITVGNLLAIPQQNVKRLLAYSSVSHAGYVLLGFVASQTLARHGGSFAGPHWLPADYGLQGVLVYLLGYLLMNVGAFAIVIAVAKRWGGEDLEHFAGLSQRDPVLAYTMMVFLLSLAGLPPTVGFVAKFYVIGATVQAGAWVPHSGLLWLALVAGVNSVIALYYYMRVGHQMFFVDPPASSEAPFMSTGLKVVMGTTAVLVLACGLFPDSLIQLVKGPLVWIN